MRMLAVGLLSCFRIDVVLALRCYACIFNYNEPYDLEQRNPSTSAKDNRLSAFCPPYSTCKDTWCANESLVQYASEDTSKECAIWEKFCYTAVTTVLGSFESVTRGCVERCSELCESDSYGQDRVNCDDCCQEDLCNNNFSVQYYIDMMSRQYTSWTDPLPGELAYNKKNGIRFPYG